MKHSGIVIVCLFLISGIKGQQVLTLEEAISTGLANSYELLIYKNETKRSELNNAAGNAGMLPQVGLNGSLNSANMNSYQEFGNGTNQDKKNAKSVNANLSLGATWTIFDGLKMFSVKKRLANQAYVSELQYKKQAQDLIYDIILAYYNIVRTKKMIASSNANLLIYEERSKIAEAKYNLGLDSKVDMLMNQSDRNKVESDLIKLNLDLMNAKSLLNQLLIKDISSEFDVVDTIVVDYEPKYEELKQSVLTNNIDLQISRGIEKTSKLSVKESKAGRLPLIQLVSSYNIVNNKSQAGFVLLNRQSGITGGVTASWSLFSGGKTNRLVKEMELNYENSKLTTQQAGKVLDSQVFQAYEAYKGQKIILLKEQENLQIATELMSIALERYKLGKSTIIELKESQKMLEESQFRYVDALYAAKKSETDLIKANGKLVN